VTDDDVEVGTPCWELYDHENSPMEYGDGVRHYPTREKALEQAAEYPDRAPWDAREADYQCMLIACQECGYRLDEDGEGIEHVDVIDAERHARDYGWMVVAGTFYCPECPEASLSHELRTTAPKVSS
jgi:hypothetical protein